MNLVGNWSYPTTIKFGAGRIAELPAACAQAGIQRPLLVTDRGLADLAITKNALAIMDAAGLGQGLFTEVDPNPNEINLEAGVAAYRAGGHDGVIAFGGGSGLDLGKMVAFMARQARPVWDFEDIGDWWTRADAGGTATGDAVLAWLQQEFGGDFAAATTEAMSHGAMRKGEESQKLLSSIDPVLRRMRSLMRDHLAQPFKLGQICQVLNVSEKQLRTRCQRTFGLTPQAYYLVVRLEQGQYLLRNTHMPITEVALATGFGSLTGFSRAFRNLYGASPRTYRKVVGSDNLIDTTQQRRTSNGIDTVGGWRS